MRRAVTTALAPVAGAYALVQVLTGIHWPLDVLGAVLVASLAAAGTRAVLGMPRLHRRCPSPARCALPTRPLASQPQRRLSGRALHVVALG